MDPKDIVAKLRQIPLFETLTTAREELELYRIAKLVNFAEYDPGEWLFAQGQPASRLYLILRGRVRLTALDREGIIRHLGDKEPGDSFGETGLLVGDFHDATAEALSPTEVLYLERAPFLELLNERRRLRDWLNLTAALREQEKISRADWMRDDEWPLYKSNRHWIFLARRIFLPILLLFVVFLGPLLLALEPAILLTVWGLLGLPLLGFSLWHYIDWRDDRFTVTTQRVVHIERAGPFRESFEEASLNNIEDVYEARPNLTANLLDYGDVIPHTAGATVEIDLMGIPHPSRVRELILLQIQRNQARRVTLTRSTIREELESRLRLEPPPEPASPAKSTARPPSSAGIAAGLIKDFFFPASWSESEQGDTIKWRRFWLPGFIRYLWLFLPLVVIAMFGIWFFPSRWGDGRNIIWIVVWVVIEVILFFALLLVIQNWRNDFFEITPNRIIHVDREPLMGRMKRRDASLDRIQNISSDFPDPISRVFKYGHVTLETAGEQGKFELQFVRHPDKVRAEISKRQQAFEQRKMQREAQRRQQELLSWFAIYDNLKGGAASAPPGPARP